MNKSNWLKKLIFEDDGLERKEDEPKSQEEKEIVVEKKAQPTHEKKTPTITPEQLQNEYVKQQAFNASQITGKVDQTLQDKLCNDVLGKQMAEGIDYVKFKRSVDSLKNIQPDENMRFNTAYLTLKATYPSLTTENLCQTINQYIDLMEQERKKGITELNNLRSQNIDKKEAEVNNALINIDKMKAEIQKLMTFVTQTNIELVDKKNEYAIQEADFNVTVDRIVNQLKNDKLKIETIIKSS